MDKDLKKFILLDVIFFILLISFVNIYKTFFFIFTGFLVAYLSYRLVISFIEISTATSISSFADQSTNNNNEDNIYEFKLANFLFRNSTLIRTLKKISRNRFVKIVFSKENNSIYCWFSFFVKRFVKFSITNCPLEEQHRNEEIEVTQSNIQEKVNLKAKSKYEKESLPGAISRFSKRIRFAYVERWYHVFVSKNEQFPLEVIGHCETLLNDVIGRLLRMEKLKIFSDGAYIVNNNYINMAIYNHIQGRCF